MLKNYYQINEESTIGNFLKEFNDKKNSRYIILEDGLSYVDFRGIALNVKDTNEKLKTLKRPLSKCKSENELECLKHLIESGDIVIKTKTKYYDLSDAYKTILKQNFSFLNNKIKDVETKKEIFALNTNDKISSAKKLFKEKQTNLLPVIENLKIIGELRPIDLLVNKLFTSGNIERSSYYNENHKDSVMNLPISNIINPKPHTISKNSKLKEALELLEKKALPSIIICNEDKLYSILTYKDIFKLIQEETKQENYTLEIVGSSNLYEDEIKLLKAYSKRSLEKITKLSHYKNLKITIKTIGNTTGTHIRKVIIKFLLSHGNQILTTEKEMHSSTINEELHSHQKENWNIPKMTQEALKNLEKLVKNEIKKTK